MISYEELDEAVAAGVLPTSTAHALRRHVESRRRMPIADEEHFRLLTGFNDLFVVIAGLLVLVSLHWLVNDALGAPFGAVAMSMAAWGLAEFFVRRRSLALPAIVLTLAWLAGWAMVGHDAGPEGMARWQVAAAAAVLAALVHWWRFHVPITWAAASGATAVGLFAALPQALVTPALVLIGLATLAAAVAWDMSDRQRLTRRADVAFWLHLVAAPLLVHTLFSLLESLQTSDLSMVAAVLAAYVLLAWLSLVLDRRALMVSSLSYVLFAVVTAMKTQTSSIVALATVPLVAGAGLLVLSAHWNGVRRRVVTRLPAGLQDRLAPTRRDA